MGTIMPRNVISLSLVAFALLFGYATQTGYGVEPASGGIPQPGPITTATPVKDPDVKKEEEVKALEELTRRLVELTNAIDGHVNKIEQQIEVEKKAQELLKKRGQK